MVIDFPHPTLFHGNDTASFYIDRADSSQHGSEDIFQEKKGGSVKMIAHPASGLIPTQKTTIKVNGDKSDLVATIGKVRKIKSRLKNEFRRSMVLQGACFAAGFKTENEHILVPGATQWPEVAHFDRQMRLQNSAGMVINICVIDLEG